MPKLNASRITAIASSVLAFAAIVTVAWVFFQIITGFGELRPDVEHLQAQVSELKESQEILRRDILAAIENASEETTALVGNHTHDENRKVLIPVEI